jgi:hypothetical protein
LKVVLELPLFQPVTKWQIWCTWLWDRNTGLQLH